GSTAEPPMCAPPGQRSEDAQDGVPVVPAVELNVRFCGAIFFCAGTIFLEKRIVKKSKRDGRSGAPEVSARRQRTAAAAIRSVATWLPQRRHEACARGAERRRAPRCDIAGRSVRACIDRFAGSWCESGRNALPQSGNAFIPGEARNRLIDQCPPAPAPLA